MKPAETQKHTLLLLFFHMIRISTFTFGGGFVIVNFMKRTFVDKLHWLDDDEMMDMIAIAQSSPGAIAVNGSIQVGWKVGGFIGMMVAVLGTIIPPMVILSVISLFYKAFATNLYVSLVLKGMKAGVAAVILDVVCSLGDRVVKEKSWFSDLLMAGAFLLVFFLDCNVVFVILGAALIGVVKYLVMGRKK
ncbi:MAG: chromate transporter [Sphaerochaetaceae bacterium]|nr:chromate transporter [Spirochaetales bacterium]MDY5500190.1 chromate transporter [Sphaerochaetaceae bacterium]